MPRSGHYLRTTTIALTIAAASLVATTASAGTPEQQCQQGRYLAAAKYAACQQKAFAKRYAGGTSQAFESASAKCSGKYVGVWARLAAKATGTGSSCDNPRFVDNGDGTVTDRLTGLRWEKKTAQDAVVNFADPHDADNPYSWSTGGESFTAADGSAFTSFLEDLNGASFAGQCDWRLPTFAELQTILAAPYLCGSTPCIDPVFGATGFDRHWSATTRPDAPTDAWTIEFAYGSIDTRVKQFDALVRAVRGGV